MDDGEKKEKTITLHGDKKFVVVDANYGKCIRISISEGVEVLLAPRCPIKMETVIEVEYENGKVEVADTFPKESLYLGWVRCYTDDGRPGFLCNKQVVAAVAMAMANLETFLDGDLYVPSEEEADGILGKYDVPMPLISYDEAAKTRPYVEVDWMKRWKRSGKLCFMTDLNEYEIEGTISENRKAFIGKTGEEVKAEMGGVVQTDSDERQRDLLDLNS